MEDNVIVPRRVLELLVDVASDGFARPDLTPEYACARIILEGLDPELDEPGHPNYLIMKNERIPVPDQSVAPAIRCICGKLCTCGPENDQSCDHHDMDPVPVVQEKVEIPPPWPTIDAEGHTWQFYADGFWRWQPGGDARGTTDLLSRPGATQSAPFPNLSEWLDARFGHEVTLPLSKE